MRPFFFSFKKKRQAIIIMFQGFFGKKNPKICSKEVLSLRESREVDLKADTLKDF